MFLFQISLKRLCFISVFYHTTETLNYFLISRLKYINLITNSNMSSTKYITNCISFFFFKKKKYRSVLFHPCLVSKVGVAVVRQTGTWGCSACVSKSSPGVFFLFPLLCESNTLPGEFMAMKAAQPPSHTQQEPGSPVAQGGSPRAAGRRRCLPTLLTPQEWAPWQLHSFMEVGMHGTPGMAAGLGCARHSAVGPSLPFRSRTPSSSWGPVWAPELQTERP